MALSSEMETCVVLKNAKTTLTNYQNYRTKLIYKGSITPDGYGQIRFVLPRFKEFILKISKFII